MNEPNKRFAQALLALASAFNAECDEMKVRAFWMGLDDIPIEKIELAVRLAMKGCKFMPTVRELRELAGEMSPEQRAIRAFDAFAGAVQSLGCCGSPDFDDRVINATVNNMGGWLRICERADEPDFDIWGRKEFERIYVSLCRTGISSEMGSRLIGYHEQQNTAAGYLRGLGRSFPRLQAAARTLGWSLEFEGLPLVPWPLPNVWVGASVEHQATAFRVQQLRDLPAAVRFLSCEPLLGPLELDLTGMDWVIVGGESGPGHRPCNPDWVRSLRDQCLAAKVPFLFKQWGGYTAKAHGRELDGRLWDEYPDAKVTL